MAWSKMVDMEMDDEAVMDMACPMPIPMSKRPRYPYGLKICLTHAELKKLGLDADCNVGDTIDLRAFAEVTCVSKDGEECRVELQIQKLALEDEDQEETPEAETTTKRKRLYDKAEA